MKRPGLTPLVLAATLFLVTSLGPEKVLAQDMKDPSSAAKGAKRAEELLKRFDKNGDGKLDDDERADAKEVMMKEQIDRQMERFAALPGGLEAYRAVVLEMFDKNRDGRLDDDERTVAQKFAESRREPVDGIDDLTKRFDKNGDGKIDASESAQIAAYLAELRALGAVRIRGELLRRFDRNADGRIDDAEMVELEKFVRPRIEADPVQLRRHDKNNDGELDADEWAAARAVIAQWMNAGGPAPLGNESLSGSASTPASTKVNVEQEQARLNAMATEVERRRALRAAAPPPGGPPK